MQVNDLAFWYVAGGDTALLLSLEFWFYMDNSIKAIDIF